MGKNRETLEEVLDAYVASVRTPTHAVLMEWIKHYPEYEKELTDFSVSWMLMKSPPSSATLEEASEEDFVTRAMDIARSRLQGTTANRKAEEPINGLLAVGRQQGLSITRLAEICQLSVTMVRKLDLRIIAYGSIPHALILRLAQAIGRSEEAITEYLQMPMTLAAGAEYRSQAAPQLPKEPENFFDAIRLDPALKQEWRSFWQALSIKDREE